MADYNKAKAGNSYNGRAGQTGQTGQTAQAGNFGDFAEEESAGNAENSASSGGGKGEQANPEMQGFVRIKLPRGKEVIGVIVQRLGGNKMEVSCSDGKTRNCRVPGRFKRDLWLRPKDIVLVVPWEFDNEKGDVIFKYSGTAINQLRRKGLLGFMKEGF